MTTTKIATTAIAIGIGFALLFPGWLEVSRARDAANKFVSEATKREVDAKVIRSSKDIGNPFTWGRGKPEFVAARKAVNTNFLIVYANYSKSSPGENKALVSADCPNRKIRLVTQSVYEDHLSKSGYGILGERLPKWNLADYDAMLAVMVGQKPIQAGQNIFFDIVCKWDSFAT